MTTYTKLCKACNTTKSAVSFHSRKDTADGLQSQCKDCQRARQRKGPAVVEQPLPVRQNQYFDVILRMKAQGLVSPETATDMAERVQRLS